MHPITVNIASGNGCFSLPENIATVKETIVQVMPTPIQNHRRPTRAMISLRSNSVGRSGNADILAEQVFDYNTETEVFRMVPSLSLPTSDVKSEPPASQIRWSLSQPRQAVVRLAASSAASSRTRAFHAMSPVTTAIPATPR